MLKMHHTAAEQPISPKVQTVNGSDALNKLFSNTPINILAKQSARCKLY
jgi:hypothetical protein